MEKDEEENEDGIGFFLEALISFCKVLTVHDKNSMIRYKVSQQTECTEIFLPKIRPFVPCMIIGLPICWELLGRLLGNTAALEGDRLGW